MANETELSTQEENEQDTLLPDTTIVTHCIYKNDLERLIKSFEDESDPAKKETILQLINQRDNEGKSPLDLAASYGRVEVCRELLKHGADLNSITIKGYCPLHHAAAWGMIGVLKVLVENHANLQQRNEHGERARETAARYNQTECVDFLDWAEAKVNLIESIKMCQETIMDPEKVAGRISKDDKNLVLGRCKEKTEWMEITQDPTTQDFISQRLNLEEIFAPVMKKILEPIAEKPK